MENILESEIDPTIKIEDISYHINDSLYNISDDQRNWTYDNLHDISTYSEDSLTRIVILFDSFSINATYNYSKIKDYELTVRRFHKSTLDGMSAAEWDRSKTLFDFSKTKKNYDFIGR